MIYIKSVRSTMKKGCEVELGPKTILVGANGAGKSTIVQSAELATQGMVSDLDGRDQVKQHTAIARLFSEGSDIFTECTLSNGKTFSWKMDAKSRGAGFKKPEHKVPMAVRWPVQELQDILKGGTNKVGAWLEGQVVGELTEADILRAVPPDMREEVEDLMRGNPIDFMSLAKTAKDAARNLRTAATKAEKTVDALVEGLAPPMLVEEREAAQQRLDSLKPQPGSLTQAQLDYLNHEIDLLVGSYSKTSDALAALPEVDANMEQALSKLTGALHVISQHKGLFGNESSCFACGSPNTLSAQESTLQAALETVKPQFEALTGRRALVGQLQSIEAQLRSKVQRRDSVHVAEDHSAERESILRTLAEDQARSRTWMNAQAQRAQIKLDRHQADRLSAAGKALEAAGKDLLETKTAGFSTQVSAFLPEGEELGVDLESARVGLVREGEMHSALSGAEWSRVLLALASSWVDGSTPCVLVPEDRAWDRDTLTSVMGALADAPVQVIIMSTVEPDPVEGWTVVHIG